MNSLNKGRVKMFATILSCYFIFLFIVVVIESLTTIWKDIQKQRLEEWVAEQRNNFRLTAEKLEADVAAIKKKYVAKFPYQKYWQVLSFIETNASKYPCWLLPELSLTISYLHSDDCISSTTEELAHGYQLVIDRISDSQAIMTMKEGPTVSLALKELPKVGPNKEYYWRINNSNLALIAEQVPKYLEAVDLYFERLKLFAITPLYKAKVMG